MKAILILVVFIASLCRPTAAVSGKSVPEAQITDYPWLGAVHYSMSDILYARTCGATLIESNVVLTAIHCLLGLGTDPKISIRDFTVSFGRSRMLAAEKNGGIIRYQAKRIFTYPVELAKEQNYLADIALVQLDRNVEGIQPISWQLPFPVSMEDGTEVQFSGWGRADSVRNMFNNIFTKKKLKSCAGEIYSTGVLFDKNSRKGRTVLSIVERCQKMMKNFIAGNPSWTGTSLGHTLHGIYSNPFTLQSFPDAFQVRVEEGCHVSNGDSGGPVFTYEYGRAYLLGVVSAGLVDENKRAVTYAEDLSFYREWIGTVVEHINRPPPPEPSASIGSSQPLDQLIRALEETTKKIGILLGKHDPESFVSFNHLEQLEKPEELSSISDSTKFLTACIQQKNFLRKTTEFVLAMPGIIHYGISEPQQYRFDENRNLGRNSNERLSFAEATELSERGNMDEPVELSTRGG